MKEYKVNNRRIAKNTMFLYFRMVLIMAISFYTSRVVLNALGESDFGIYNVVGGVVVILSFLNGAMTGSTQRYINVELGRGNLTSLKRTFATSMIIHLWLALVVTILAETIGLWFLNSYMNIPPQRMFAANIVYQCSVFSFIATVLTVPHNAAIIAHEKMSAFAYISIVEAMLKLGSALMLLVVPGHLLSWYAFFMLITSVAPRVLFYVYSLKNFKECKVNLHAERDNTLTREMLSFSGWSVFGSLGYILHTQGIAIILNIFYGTIVNAAQGISMQVNTLVRSFSDNFLQALKPQLIQTYAAGELGQMHQLLFRGSRLAIFLTAFFAIPIIIECGSLLTLWLKIVPDYTVGFVRIVLLISLIDAFTPVLSTAQNATGKIKKYQIVLTTIGFLHLPIVILLFALGFSPMWSFYVYLIITIILQCVRIGFVCKSIDLSLRQVTIEMLLRPFATLLLAFIPPVIVHLYISPSLFATLTVLIISCISNLMTISLIGMGKNERRIIFSLVGNKLNRFKK